MEKTEDSLSILIIDDDPTHHMILGNHLKRAGYTVIHALDAEKGMAMLETQKPKLLLLDVQMPGMDGFQVLKKIKKNPIFKDLAVMFLTALKQQEAVTRGLELGADDYIVKPFDRSELLARVKAVFRRMDRKGSHEGQLEGELTEMGISDLLQSMEIGMKTATIRMNEMDAKIVIREGNLVYARQNRFIGDDALVRIFLLEKGSFSVSFNEIPESMAEKKGKALTSVLMNISNQVDEIRDIIRQMGVEDRRMILVGDLTRFPSLEKVKPMTPATVVDIISAMEGDLKTNIKILVDASSERILKVEKKG
jgi:DNA-binding response OmpR family regulator